MDKIGRKYTHCLLILPAVIGWMIIYFSKDISTIVIGRCFNGLNSGGTVMLGAIVIGEYTAPEVRGIFLNLKTAATCTGIIAAHILGHYFHWRTVALISCIVPVVAIVINLTWPESPSWLIAKKRLDQSKKSFHWLRGDAEKATLEFTNMKIAYCEKQTIDNRNISGIVVTFFRKFQQKDFVKPILVSTVAFVLLEACGRHTFPAYAVDMLGGFTGNKSHVFVYTLSIDVITTTTALVASAIVKVCKRRTLLFLSGISSVIVLLVICLYLFLVSKQILSNDNSWIPLVLFGLYFVLTNLGCTPIPLALLGELFPLAHRSVATAITGMILSLVLMVTLKITPTLIETCEVYGTFTIFAAFMIVSLVYLYFSLPETKNRTLQEIEEFFVYGKFLDESKTKLPQTMENATEKDIFLH